MSKTYEDYLKEAGNIHLAYYTQAADTLGIKYEIIKRSLMARFEKDSKHWFIINTATPLTNTTSTTIAKRKNLTNEILSAANLPVPKQLGLANKQEAVKFFEEYGNIVIKPSQQLGGIGITLLPKNKKQVEKAFKIAHSKSRSSNQVKVLGEEFIEGENYRLLVVGDKVVGVVRRKAAHVTGNGIDNLYKLIEDKNILRKERLLKAILLDNEVKQRLENLKINMKYIPKKEEEVILRYNCNLTTGGTTQECHKETHIYYKDLAVRAVKAIGTKFGGVDIITPDITKPAKCGINEINYNPGLRLHYKVDEGEAVQVAIPILEYIAKNI
jgi:D-alanine-D-alanine ligase-like ATP-grasp enzyme